MRPIGSPAERIEPEHVQERGAYMESLVDKTRHVFATLLADSGSELETSGSPPPEAVTYLSDEEPPANEATHYESKARHTASDPGAQDIASDLEGRNIASDPGARDVARDAAAAVEGSMPRTARSAREGSGDLEWSAGEGLEDLGLNAGEGSYNLDPEDRIALQEFVETWLSDEEHPVKKAEKAPRHCPKARYIARDAAAAVEDSMPRTARSAGEGYDDSDPELRIVLQEAEAVAVLLSGEEPPILEWSAGEGADDLEMEVPVRLEESIW
jgi:hypothetical protein